MKIAGQRPAFGTGMGGITYVIDPSWLAHIGSSPDKLTPSKPLDSLCSGLFEK